MSIDLSVSPSTPTGSTSAGADRWTKAGLFAWLLLVAFGFALAVSWGNLIDPFVRHDDYPTVFGEAEDYYQKTLLEGRWLNYWYISLRLTLPTEVSFLSYLTAWSVFAAAFSAHAFGRGAPVFRGAREILAVLIVLTPQAFDIAQWFNTVSPGIWVMAIYALVCLFAPRRTAVRALLVFVPLSFSAYNTYPFYLLAMLMCRVDLQRSMRDLFTTAAVFVASFALAIYLTYALNWYHHGVFGIAEAEWRRPNQLESLSDLIENFGVLKRLVYEWCIVYGMGYVIVGGVVLSVPVIAALAVMRQDRLLALYALTPVALGMGLLCFYTLMTGIYFPVRATIFVWLVSAFLVLVAVDSFGTSRARQGIFLIGLIWLMGYYAKEFVVRFQYLQMWQTATEEIAGHVPADAEKVVVYGHFAMIPGAREAVIQDHDALFYRLRFLTGKPVLVCRDRDIDCGKETPPFDPVPRFDNRMIETADGVTYIRLPALDYAP